MPAVDANNFGYYVAPPTEPRNIATAFMAGFLQTRTPYAREFQTARLAAMDPSAQAAALAALDEQAANIIGHMQQYEKDAFAYAADTGKQSSALDVAREESASRQAVANTEARVRARGQDIEAATKGQELAEVSTNTAGAIGKYEKAFQSQMAKITKAEADVLAGRLAPEAAAEQQAEAMRQALTASRDAIREAKKTAGGMELQSVAGRFRGLIRSNLDPTIEATATMSQLFEDKIVHGEELPTWQATPSTAPSGAGRITHAEPSGVGGGGEGGSVSGSASQAGGGAPLPAGETLAAAKEQLERIEAEKARIKELYTNPYGTFGVNDSGFNNPFPGKQRPTSAAMASEATKAFAERRNPTPSAAADAAPPAAAAAARAADTARVQDETLSQRVAKDIEGQGNVTYSGTGRESDEIPLGMSAEEWARMNAGPVSGAETAKKLIAKMEPTAGPS